MDIKKNVAKAIGILNKALDGDYMKEGAIYDWSFIVDVYEGAMAQALDELEDCFREED